MLILGKDCILNILENFDNTDYDDVKTLCYLSQTCFTIYYLIKHKLLHLVSFFKYKSIFKLLGHEEAIKTNNLQIVKYIISKYKIYGLHISYYLRDDMLYYMIRKSEKYIDIINYLELSLPLNKIIKDNILLGNINYLEKHVSRQDLCTFHWKRLYKLLINSDNIEIIKYFNLKYDIDICSDYSLIYSFKKCKYKIIDYIINNMHFDPENYFLHDIKDINMFKYIYLVDNNYINTINELSLSIILINEKFDIFDFIIEKIGLNKFDFDKFMWHINNVTHSHDINIYKIFKKIALTFNIDESKLIHIFKNYKSNYKYIKYKYSLIRNNDYLIDVFNSNLHFTYRNESIKIIKFCLKKNHDFINLISNDLINSKKLKDIEFLKFIKIWKYEASIKFEYLLDQFKKGLINI